MAKAKDVNPNLLKGLGLTQIEILNAISELSRDDMAYGLKIAAELGRSRGGFFNPAQVFMTLSRLVKRDLIVQEGTREEEGVPVMKLYQLTDKGTETLRAWRTRFDPRLGRAEKGSTKK